ncbi:MAG TPA: type II toxin-antitoxin system death-on-curing family toxin [Candidatus Krumholzibacterium sp.]|nr:type II toxin-antitoxin system death-on-curing family toxin [Candidatus Krumholzibacterium sp.]
MRRRIRWIPDAAVRAMHAELLAEHGGRPGIRDEGLLSSALGRPRNRRAYGPSASLFDIAAAYGFGIVKNHPFIDGNKRSALAVMYVFLEINGYRLDAPEVEATDIILRLAAGKLGEKDLAGWLQENSVPSRGKG